MENQQRMEQFLQSEHQTRQMQEAEQQIEKELASIKASNPDVDELRVIQTAMATGQNLTEAAKLLRLRMRLFFSVAAKIHPL